MSDSKSALDEILASMRHDEGCSAGIDEKYRCRCNLKEFHSLGTEELSALRARVTALEECLRALADAAAESAQIEEWFNMKAPHDEARRLLRGEEHNQEERDGI